ncbi:MAG: RlpA-like double-psi beta-barrel domain-containing protein [Collinsella sp.]|nr:RlpA-like double-psi beta-barrel domain-containing protein [Collinsella sp.]
MRKTFGSTHPSMRRASRAAVVAGLTAALALGPAPIALAASASTASELERLSQEVDTATSDYLDATSRAEELDRRVAELADEILVLEQEVLPAQQALASDAAVNLYKMHSVSAGGIGMLLGAQSLSDFIEIGKYLDVIQSTNTDALEELNDLRDELEGKLEEISAAKDEAIEQQQIAEDSLARAKDAQSQMTLKAAAEDAEAARRAAEAQEAIDRAEEQTRPTVPETGGGTTPQQPGGGTEPDGGTDGGTEGGGEVVAPPQTGWMSGVASYYGIGDGFMGQTTASGEIVTETSMGIAMLGVPFGTRVEISYRGRSVIAYVNDRGPYVHGRVIDMQPAVARALDFLSVGVGTVQYRFL